MMCFGKIFLTFLVFGICGDSEICRLITFFKFRTFRATLNSFFFFLSILFFRYSSQSHLRIHHGIYYCSSMLLSFFFNSFFSLYVSFWITSIAVFPIL